jgi:hypothetical protein
MQYIGYVFRSIVIAILVTIVFAQNSFSYIDPGTGSYIFQMLIAGLLGALFALKIFWGRLKLFFINLFSKSN